MLGAAAPELRAAGVQDARAEGLLLLTHTLGASKAELLAHPDRCVGEPDARRFAALVSRRVRREPFAYIVGRREFYGRSFRVDRRVLVPRPETETLVDEALSSLRELVKRGVDRPLVVDVGTGSGAIAWSVALEAPSAYVVAVDCSADALDVAAANRERLGVGGSTSLVQGDLLGWLRRPVDLIVANLPYLASDRLPASMPEVARFEPPQALDGGPDGMTLVRRLVDQARCMLEAAGTLLLELDPPQIRALRHAFPGATSRVIEDLAGLPRVLRFDRA